MFQRSNGRWIAQITLEDGKQKPFYAKSEKEANVMLRKALNELECGSLITKKRPTTQALPGTLVGACAASIYQTEPLSEVPRYRDVPPFRKRRLLRIFQRWTRPARKLLLSQVQNDDCRVGVSIQFDPAFTRMPPHRQIFSDHRTAS